MHEDALNVFVYGTLQPGGRFHDDFCSRQQFTAHPGWVAGRLFDFPERGYPAAAEDPHNKVYGFLLSFTRAAHSLLHALDELEGYDPQRAPAENLYYRAAVDVNLTMEQDRRISAWCYFMPAERIRAYGGIEVDSGRWGQPGAVSF